MPDGNIKLSVSLNVQNAVQSANQLQQAVDKAFDGKNIEAMDKGLQRVANEIISATDKVKTYNADLQNLQGTMERLSAQAQSGQSVAGASSQYDTAIQQINKYENKIKELQGVLEANAKNSALPKAIQAPVMSAEEISQTQQQIVNYQAKLEELRNTMQSMQSSGTAFPNLSANIETATNALNGATTQAMLLMEQFNSMQSTADIAQPIQQQTSAVEQSMQDMVQAVQQGVQEVQQVQQTGAQATSAVGQTGVSMTSSMESSINRLENSVRRIETILNNTNVSFSNFSASATNAGKAVSSSFASMSKSVGRASSHTNKLGKIMEQTFSAKGLKRGLTTILKYGFGIRSLYFLFRRLRTAVKEGLQNLVKYERAVGTSKAGLGANNIFKSTNQAITSLNTSLLYLKNAWAAAFAPIINTVMPILTSFIDGLARIGNYIARFVGALTGQKTVLQAVKTSAGDYAKSLDKSSGKAKKAAKNQKKLNDRLAEFDDLKVLGKDDKDKGTGGIGGGASTTGADPKNMFKRVKVDKKEFQWILDLIDDIKKKIKESGIVDAIKNLWDALKKFKDSDAAKVLGEIAKIVVSESFQTALSLITYWLQLIADILNGDWVNVIQDIVDYVAALTFDPWITFAKVIDSLLGTDVAGWIDDIKSAFTNLPQLIIDVVGKIRETFDTLVGLIDWDAVFNTDLFTEFCDILADGWGVLIDGVAGGVDKLVSFFTITIPSAASKLGSMLATKWTEIKTGAQTIWANIKQVITETVDTIKRNIIAKIDGVKSSVLSIWETLKSNTVQKFTDLKNSIVDIFNAVKDAIKTPINGILTIVQSMINKIINGVNGIIDKLNNIPSLQFKNPFNGQEYKLGFNIPKLGTITIPKLAEGAVIPPNREFLATLGDQSHGTNIEAPLDTIKQAVAEVMANNGNQEMIRLLQQLITVVENKNLVIGDKAIGQANARYNNQQKMIRGTSF